MAWISEWLPGWFAAWFGGAGGSAPGLVQSPASLSGSAQLTPAESDSGGFFPLAVRRWWRTVFAPPAPNFAARGRLTAAPASLSGSAQLTPPDESLELLLLLAAG